jgi:glycerol-3-phosphate acyltransferase PlsY
MSWMRDLHSINWDQAIGLGVFAYALGCFTAGYYLVRWLAGIDIREVGSGSAGARNVSRVLGKPGFFLTLCLDFGKGLLAVWMARYCSSDDRLAALSLLAVVAGHIWPVQLRFHGGKGMATSLGALLVYESDLAWIFGFLFLILAAALRRAVLPSLIALTCLPVVSQLLGHAQTGTVQLWFLAGLVVIAHRRNLTEEFADWWARRQAHHKVGGPRL